MLIKYSDIQKNIIYFLIMKNLNFYECQRANMKISLEKSKFVKLETACLGNIVSIMLLKRIGTENIRELRNFLALTGYYRKFVHNYAKISKPLAKVVYTNFKTV